MMLIASTLGVVVPYTEWHVVSVGCTANIFEIIVAEEVGTVVLMHHTTILTDIYGDILSDVLFLKLLEDFHYVLFVTS
jgi:hypothetical protein